MVIDDLSAGLRCHDVHSGLRNVDPHSATITPLADTRIVGMAAGVAGLIRGQDVIKNADALRSIAADQLDVSPYAFASVIRLLEDVGFVTTVTNGHRIESLTENIPYHQVLFDQLGEAWRANRPSQVEEEMVALVDRLAKSPVPAEELEDELGLDRADIPRLLEVGKASDLVKSIAVIDGEVLYSPFFGFENPELLAELLEEHGSARFGEELAAIREHQGLPLDEKTYPALADAVARGFVLAPSVTRPDKVEQPFLSVPYLPDRSLLTVRKAVLEKSLAVLACVRCGQHYGGATSTREPVRVLNALLDPSRGHQISPHSSHQRQYQLLYRMQVVDFVPSGSWVSPKLIVTDDNLEAVRIARDLMSFGEPMEDRGVDDAAKRLLSLDSPYQAPMQTVHRRRNRKSLSDKEYATMMANAMGRAAL